MVLPIGPLFLTSSQMLNGQRSIAVCLVVTISVKQKLGLSEPPKNMVNFNSGVLSCLFFFMGRKKP